MIAIPERIPRFVCSGCKAPSMPKTQIQKQEMNVFCVQPTGMMRHGSPSSKNHGGNDTYDSEQALYCFLHIG